MSKLKPKKRGRKLGVKVGPYVTTISLKQMYSELKELRAQVAKLMKVLN